MLDWPLLTRAASRRQHKQLYQVQGRYLRYVGLVALACVLYYDDAGVCRIGRIFLVAT